MRSFAILAFLVLTACGKVDSPPLPDAGPDAPVENTDGLKSGTRLKIRWNVFDGTKSFAGLFDTTRNELCTPRKFADAKTYCVPVSATIAYSDANCTMPIGRQFRTCPMTPITYFTEIDPLTCDSLPKRIFPRGAQLALPTYYVQSGTSCLAQSSTGYDLFSLGAEIPLTEFVTAEEKASTDPGRMQQRFFETSDGARVFSTIYDSELASECTFTLDVTRGSAKCIPTSTGLGSLFGDAGCTQQRASFRKGCTVPKFASRFSRFCQFAPSVPDLYRTGLLASATLYSGAPGSCTAVTGSTDFSYYDVPLALVEPGVVTRAPDTEGKGRYRLLHYSSGANLLRDAPLYDTARQTECTPTTMQDGSVRCLPTVIYGTTMLFSDAGCTAPAPVILVPSTPANGCTLPALPAFSVRTVVTTTPTCSVAREARSVGAVYTGALYTGTPANCAVFNAGTNTTVYTLGAMAATEDFPAATVVTDP